MKQDNQLLDLILTKIQKGEISPACGYELIKQIKNKGNAHQLPVKAVVLKKPGLVKDILFNRIVPPDPGDMEVQVLIKASSLNFADLLCVKGLYPNMPEYPFTPGFEFSGIIIKLGSNVHSYSIGDEVFGMMSKRFGGQSYIINTDQNSIIRKPGNISHEEACSIPVVFLTTYYSFEKVNLKENEKILIQTAAGGIGLMCVQLAKMNKADIYATAGSAYKLDYLKGLGVANLINYRENDFAKEIIRMTSGYGVDVVINTLSGDAIQKGLNLLAPEGRYVEIAMTGLKSSNKLDLSRLVDNQMFFSIDLNRFLLKNPAKSREYFEVMARYLSEGIIKPFVNRIFPFENVVDAYQFIEQRKNIGKVVLTNTEYDKLLMQYLKDKKSSNKEVTLNSPDSYECKNNDIAVIGISCRFPGAGNKQQFWENLAGGVDSIKEVPGQRWDINKYYHLDENNRIYCRWGGFLDSIDSFDAAFFGISGIEAELTDPQQKIFLEECFIALEDAGYATNKISNKRCGVFAGVTKGDYDNNLCKKDAFPGAYAFMGNANSILTARISYYLNLKGPSLAIDTACSSSLVAIHYACQSIIYGECEMAIAGGVYVNTTPYFYGLASKCGMLSSRGRCQTFDDNADGFVPGEGAGVIILKRMDKAIKDRDHIYGVIKGSCINQDGRTNGITAPSSISQTDVELAAYQKAKINPVNISYIEAHGTGTTLGDPVEVDALINAFRSYTSDKSFCALGSVKTNIGHTVAAAGVASVIKVLLAIQNNKIPPLINFTKPNKNIDFENSPFYVNTELIDWPLVKKNKLAAVSSFGFSGTNVHMVIGEPEIDKQNNKDRKFAYHFIPFSAKTKDALCKKIDQFLTWLGNEGAAETILNISYTLCCRREHYSFRCIFLVPDKFELEKVLRKFTGSKKFRDKMIINIRKNTGNKDNKSQSDGKSIINALNASFYNNYNWGSTLLSPSPSKNRNWDSTLLSPASSKNYNWGSTLLSPNSSRNCNRDSTLLSTGNTGDKNEVNEKCNALADLFKCGVDLDWEELFKKFHYKCISLPGYPFAKDRYWYGESETDIDQNNVEIAGNKTKAVYKKTWKQYEYTCNNPEPVKGNIVVIVNNEISRKVKNHFKQNEECNYIFILNSTTQPDNGFCDYIFDFFSEIESLKAFDCIKDMNISGIIDVSDVFLHNPVQFQIPSGKILFWQKVLDEYKNENHFKILHFTSSLQPFLSVNISLSGTIDAALMRDIRSEYSKVFAKTIDIDSVESIDAIILREWNFDDYNSEICYRNGKRYIPFLDRVLVEKTAEDLPSINSDKTYVITGGTGGIGMEMADNLVRLGATKLVLMGYNQLPERQNWDALQKTGRDEVNLTKIKKIRKLEDKGACVKIYTGPLTDGSKLKSFFSRIREELGEIGGVLHCAGLYIFNDPAFIHKKIDDMQKVFEPKINGLMVMHELMKDYKPDFFILFSSVAALIPGLSPGLIDYSIANAFMDYFAGYQNLIGNTYYKSIWWLNWKQVGMARQTTYSYSSMGFSGLNTNEGIELFNTVLNVKNTSQLFPVFLNPGQKEIFNIEQLLLVKNAHKAGKVDNKKVLSSEPIMVNQTGIENIKNLLIDLFSTELKLPKDRFEGDISFEEYGFDSIVLVDIVKKLESKFDKTLNPSIFLEYPTINLLAEYIMKNGITVIPESSRNDEVPHNVITVTDNTNKGMINNHPHKDKIAVIGIGLNFPESKNKEKFWSNLKSGKNCITKIPPGRWKYIDYYSPAREKGKSISKWGGFIDGIEYFDPHFFNIKESVAPQIDPLVRLLLEVGVNTFRDAGYSKEELSGKKTGVFIGSRMGKYANRISEENLIPESIIGTGQNFIAAHLSHFFNLKGPNLVIDTACSSSLVSIHFACQSIMSGESEMAVAGGVDVLLDKTPYLVLTEAGALSPDGKCHVFDEKANGFVPGEGCGAVLLKALNRAIADGDQIYAVIDSSAVNNDGHTMGFTTPSIKGQMEVIRSALKKGDIDPDTISCIEAHGTGTMIGDPIELKGLTSVFADVSGEKQYCSVGSIKTNIGHLFSAAGIASFIKIVLSLYHKKLVPSLHCENPNPRFNFKDSPFYPHKVLTDWKARKGIRRAGISAFGFGGTNAHIIVSEGDYYVANRDDYILKRESLGDAQFNKKKYWIIEDHLNKKDNQHLKYCDRDSTNVEQSPLNNNDRHLKKLRLGINKVEESSTNVEHRNMKNKEILNLPPLLDFIDDNNDCKDTTNNFSVKKNMLQLIDEE